jgi:signal peptidase I
MSPMSADAVADDSGRSARDRSVLLAVVLSGLGPGAGHLYVGKGRRGAFLVLLWIASTLAWTTRAAMSWSDARFWALPWLLLLIAILVDSGRQARRAPRPFRCGPLQRWWIYALVIVVIGNLVPLALTRVLARQAGIITMPFADESMQPRILPFDRIVFARRFGDLAAGDVVVVAGSDGLILRRVVGLPGQRVEVRAGRVVLDGQRWIRDPARLSGGSRLRIEACVAEPGEVLVLSDGRDASEAASWRMPRAAIVGRATWLLIPGDLDPLRVGEPIR